MTKVIIRQLAAGGYQWQWYGQRPFGLDESASGDFEALRSAVTDRSATIWLLLPGEHFFLQTVAFDQREKRHLRQVVPYQLEELLIEDIEDLHFALGEPAEGKVPVAVCNRDWLHAQLAPFTAAEIELARVLPDFLLLQRRDGWALRLSGGKVLAHTGVGAGLVMEPELAVQALRLLREEQSPDEIPVLVTAADQQALDNFSGQLQRIAGLQIEQQVRSWWQVIENPQMPEIDLRQREFGRRLPLQHWWRQWRKVAIFAAVTLAVYLAVSAVEYGILQSRNLELRQQTEQAFRSVVPKGVIVDAEKQLRSKLNSLQGSAGGTSAAVAMLAEITPVIVANKDVSLRALHYSGDEMRLGFWARSFNAIEQLRAKIAALGLEVELVQVSADGDGHQARLRIRGGVKR